MAVNDLGSIDTMAHLLKYDSVMGTLPDKIVGHQGGIKVGNDTLQGAVASAIRPICRGVTSASTW